MNNWYKKSMGLPPSYTNIPSYPDNTYGVEEIDKSMSEEVAQQESEKHPEMDYLGSGGLGVAFVNPKDNLEVIKYTSDWDEYEAAKEIFERQGGSNIPGIITVYDVEELPGPVYKITTEKVKLPNSEEKDILIPILILEISNIIEYHLGDYIDYIAEDGINYILRHINNKLGGNWRQNKFESIVKKYGKEKVWDVIKKYYNLFAKINNTGSYMDYSTENIGIDSNGEYIIIDIGGLEFNE